MFNKKKMKIQTFNSNLIQAIDQDTSIPDRNLPVYVTNYTVHASPSSLQDSVRIAWSTVGFLPSYEEAQRIIQLRLVATVDGTDPSFSNVTFVFDFSRLGRRFLEEYNITLKGPLEGYVTDGEFIRCLSAYRHVTYQYDATTFTLLLYVRDLPMLGAEGPRTLFLNISIKDDVNDPDYPVQFPLTIANVVMKIPINTPYKGRGIRIVLPMFICCPDELKTMQLSSIDPELEGAFNPIPQIKFLLQSQGQPVPETLDIQFIDANASPASPDPPINWKENLPMRQIAFVLQVLFTVVPECSVIVLYSLAYEDLTRPAYMVWIRDNVDSFDMVLETQYLGSDTEWTLNAFNETKQFYNEVQQLLFTKYRPFVVASGNFGNEDYITYPKRVYDFNGASTFAISVGAFQLARDPVSEAYSMTGPYEASPNSNGGYSNMTERPAAQYGLNYRNLFGRPDIAGYFGYYACTINPPDFDGILGTEMGAAVIAGLFAMIMDKTQRRDWPFKPMLYRKGLTIVNEYYLGQNIGSTPINRYNARNYQYWNPLIGMGNVNGQYLLDMCNAIRNFDVVQISPTRAMNNPIAFVNAMPPNPFGDLLIRQPVMGCSSIFSLFYIKRVDGNDPPVNDEEPIRGNDLVYFVDITERFALAYAFDDDEKWFVVLSKVNYASSAQKWLVTLGFDPSSTDSVFAFDDVVISPALQPQYSLTSKWNAGGAAAPASPSISYNFADPEYFTLFTDPACLPFIADIAAVLSDDINGYSYYVNFAAAAGTDTKGEIVYLNNPDFLGMDGDVPEIYEARNRAQSTRVTPKWGYKFDPYPQWVLVPVPSTYSNPDAGPYQTAMLRNAQYMIFNTILQAYLYVPATRNVPPETAKPYLKPLTPSVTDTIPFTSFLFTITDSIFVTLREKAGPIFTGRPPVIPGLPFNTVIDPFLADLYIYNRVVDTESPRDFTFITYSFSLPELDFTDELTILETQGDTILGDEIPILWVFKKYISTQTSLTRWFAYNDQFERRQENATYALSALGIPSNINNHAPSLKPEQIASLDFFWFSVTDSYIEDLNVAPSPANRYGIIHEGLWQFEPEATELIINSVLENESDPDVVFSIGVFGNPPQPVMLPEPFSQAPNAIRWNVSTLNQFFTSRVRRSYYFYFNTVYCLYSMNPLQLSSGPAGFLSSAKNDGATPSIVGRRAQQGAFNGDNNTNFLMLPLS